MNELWDKIERRGPDECWLWTGATYPYGYGRWKDEDGKWQGAHRAVYIEVYGVNLCTEQIVRHTCDNPPCCNPYHLLLGTHRDNSHDRVERGRQRTGPKLPGPTLPRLAYTVTEVCELSGITRTKFYALIRTGQIRTRRIGNKHLVLVDELKRFLHEEDAA